MLQRGVKSAMTLDKIADNHTFLNALMNYGDNMANGIANYRIPLLNTKYYFERKNMNDGYENTFWNVYQYKNYEKVLQSYE